MIEEAEKRGVMVLITERMSESFTVLVGDLPELGVVVVVVVVVDDTVVVIAVALAVVVLELMRESFCGVPCCSADPN